MTTVVSYSEFRKNMAAYLDLVREEGHVVKIKDAKRGKIIAEVKAPSEAQFDWDAHMKFMENFKPVFTDKDVEQIKELRRKDRERIKKSNW